MTLPGARGSSGRSVIRAHNRPAASTGNHDREPRPQQDHPTRPPRHPPGEVTELINGSTITNYPAGTILCHENAIEDTFYLILEGAVEVTKVINNKGNYHETFIFGFICNHIFINECLWCGSVVRANPHRNTNRYTNAYFYCFTDDYPHSYGNARSGWAM